MKKFDEMEMLWESPFAKPLRFEDVDDGNQEEDLLEVESAWELAFERGARMASEEFLGETDDY